MPAVSTAFPEGAVFLGVPGGTMVRNTSSIRKVKRRGKIHWVIDFCYVDGRGRQRRYRRDAQVQSAHGAKAEAARLQMMAVTLGSLEPKTQVPTLAAFARGQFAELFMGKYRPSTRKRYEGMLPLLISQLGSRRLDEVGARDARVLAAELTTREISTKPHVNLLKTILRAAHELGVIEDLPKLPKLHRESRKLPDCPSRDEVDRILVAARGWLRVAVASAAFAGLRMGEVRALEVRDVDLDAGVINVRRSLSEDQVVSPKSGHDRVVPIAAALSSVIADAVRDKLPRATVVMTVNGTTPGRTYVLRKFKALQRRLGLPGWSFHSLRHAFISELVRAGASIEAVRLLAGHSKLDVTQRYVHATGEDLRAAMSGR